MVDAAHGMKRAAAGAVGVVADIEADGSGVYAGMVSGADFVD